MFFKLPFRAFTSKPVKWRFKLWELADMTGYTMDFNIYTGKSDLGLFYDVVVEPNTWCLQFSGYEDNFYFSPTRAVKLAKL